MQASILWYDFETFGANPQEDAPSQFAAQRTDLNLMPIEAPQVFYCQPLIDRLVAPDAVAITGIAPQHAQQHGVNEFEFAQRVHSLMAEPNTTTCGYNTIRFDDEVCRFMFWRNLIDPYGREYKNNNARFDLLDVMRLTSALRPDGLYWPKRDDGLPSFKLEQLSVANGIEHTEAHDAMADVRATIGLAQKVKKHQEKLWHYVFDFRSKFHAKRFFEQLAGGPFLHASGKISAEFHGVSALLPLMPHPNNRNEIICWDLRFDPSDMLAETADALLERLYSKKESLPEGVARPAFKSIHLNKAPAVAPISLLDDAVSQRIQLDSKTIARHIEVLKQSDAWKATVLEMFSQPYEGGDKDPEHDLYGGFVSMSDRHVLDKLIDLPPQQWPSIEDDIGDPRLLTLCRRLRARHFSYTLTQSEQVYWMQHMRKKLPQAQLETLLKEAKQRKKRQPEQAQLWQLLADWYQEQINMVGSAQLSLF